MKLEPVNLSEAAIHQIKHIMEHKNIPDEYALRVGVKGAGCGVGFQLGFDKPKEDDLSYSVDGINILVDKKHTMYVLGVTVDYYSGSDAQGFTFVKDEPATAQK
ncbi:MAG: iron-sulfur cluster assembly accessory protein [Bacteroidota bacterium]